jgi:DUF1680 family protein
LNRRWEIGDVVLLDLPMPPRLTRADDRIDAARGRAAIERGPLVYCLEQADHKVGLDSLLIEKGTEMTVTESESPGARIAVEASGQAITRVPDRGLYQPLDDNVSRPGDPVMLRAIPYFAWANRGVDAMRVWIPLS